MTETPVNLTLPETPARTASTATRRRRFRILTLATATVAGLAVWLVSAPLLGIDLTVGAPPAAQTVTAVSVIIAAIVPGAIAWALPALLEHVSPRGRRIWLILGWAVLAVSLLGPVSMGAAGATLVSLLAMHLVVGVTLIVGLTRPRRDDSTTRPTPATTN